MKKPQTPWYQVAKAFMKARGIKQQEIADALGVGKSAVSLWFSGRNRPRIEVVKRIAEMLGVSVSELIGEDAYFLADSKEIKAIDLFRSISQDQQETILQLMSAISSAKEPPDKPSGG